MKIERKIDCCGSNFRREEVSLLGIFSFLLPLIFFSTLLWITLFPFSLFIKRVNLFFHKLQTIIISGQSLIEQQSIFPKQRCSISAFFLKSAPRLSSYLFRTFNIIILSSGWFFIFVGIYVFI